MLSSPKINTNEKLTPSSIGALLTDVHPCDANFVSQKLCNHLPAITNESFDCQQPQGNCEIASL